MLGILYMSVFLALCLTYDGMRRCYHASTKALAEWFDSCHQSLDLEHLEFESLKEVDDEAGGGLLLEEEQRRRRAPSCSVRGRAWRGSSGRRASAENDVDAVGSEREDRSSIVRGTVVSG